MDLGYLFRAANATIYAVGKVFDALAQRYLDGNSVAYHLLSMMVVLGLLLGLQWRLLSLALQERLLAAASFSLIVFMLQPGSYWGRQNFFYHQAIPLVCLLAILALVLNPRWSRPWLVTSVAALGTIAGLAYISGAFASLTAAIVLLAFVPFLSRNDRMQLVWGDSVLLVTGIVTVVLQSKAMVATTSQALTSPSEPVFWS